MKFVIKEKRVEKGISQEELAKVADVARGTLSRLETNEDTVVNSQTLSKIAKALECPITELFVE